MIIQYFQKQASVFPKKKTLIENTLFMNQESHRAYPKRRLDQISLNSFVPKLSKSTPMKVFKM